MTIEDIIRMAREAGWDDHHAEFDTRIQTFAVLVASVERSACAKLCDEARAARLAEQIRARGQA